MRKLVLSLTAVLAGVAGTAGAALATEPAPQTAAAPVAKPVTKRAVAVVVVRTGGRHGGQSVYTQVGASSRDEAEVLRLASSPAFQSLRPRYAPAGTTKNRYTYRIEAGYRDDTKKRVIVVEGTPGTPKVALEVIRLMTDESDLSADFPPGFPFN
ncbi:hypothetical protein GCM10010168_56290 [Actinoplanes ianthinogenes]|uniref:Uncharacterized protein n=1 Tax=Actinoplanes ianthinogenes TaxID=122358 RepID=A0ABM7LQ44_9ACTN|nr:hypothetical protein [Actinoplanes ianthinogenes]BCJ41372.1 hypothetical protein Aiant_20290 [Actinoplanes ianthinogenes]GGR30603.1 hypothetical protein GCM10010168_56290 [Actinoplanes ianthinogenes]